MVKNAAYIKDKGGYSELKVMQSGAGYYVGTTYDNYDDNGKLLFQEPGSRDSDYYANREEAEALLKSLQKMDEEDAAIILRNHP